MNTAEIIASAEKVSEAGIARREGDSRARVGDAAKVGDQLRQRDLARVGCYQYIDVLFSDEIWDLFGQQCRDLKRNDGLIIFSRDREFFLHPFGNYRIC